MPPIHRTLKNKVKNYTIAEVKVREATSNDPWGPSTAIMSEIADMTYNIVAFAEIMQMVWKRVNDTGKNWRHVYKSLVLLDYLIKMGNEKVVQQCKENILMIQTLKDFQYIDEGKDQGHSVREKSKQLVQLLKDDGRIKNERTKAQAARDRYAANTGGMARSGMTRSISEKNLASSGSRSAPSSAQSGGTGGADEDLQLQLALAMSKEEHEAELKQREGDELRLQMAIEESKKMSTDQYGDSALYDNGPSGGLLDLDTPKINTFSSSRSWDGNLSGDLSGGMGGFDPWGAPAAPKTTTTSSPWDAPVYDNPSTAAPPPSYTALSGNLGPTSGGIDPWASVNASNTSSAFSQSQGGLWGSSGSGFPASGGLIPTSSSGATNGSHPGAPQLDDFDLLSSGRAGIPPTGNSNVYSNFESTNGGKSGGDIWDMKGLDGALLAPSTSGPPKPSSAESKKTAQEFLGANANLVDLDDLICKPAPASTTLSPFSMPSTAHRSQSPAAQLFKAQEEERAKSVPLNQMMTSGVTPAGHAPYMMQPMGGWPAPQQPMAYQQPGMMGGASMYPPAQPLYPQTQQAAPTSAMYPQQNNPFL